MKETESSDFWLSHGLDDVVMNRNGTEVQRAKFDTTAGVEVAGVSVPFGYSVKLLGVNLDALMTMDRHVTDVIRSYNFHIKALRHIRSSLDLDTAKMIAHGIVSAQLDYCNILPSGTSGGNFDQLQVVQNALARTVCRAPWASSVTELHRSLHWLPIRQRVEYTPAVITYNTIQTNTPST